MCVCVCVCVCVRRGLGGLEDLNGEGVLRWPVNGEGGSEDQTGESVCVCDCVCVCVCRIMDGG